MTKAHRIFAPSKVGRDHQKVQDYLDGKRIWPTTIELDLTQLCTRSCPGCPYSVARRPGLTLEMPLLTRLFGILGPHTPGIVLSGGESTIVPHFPETVALARKSGFQEIAVISNGGLTHMPKIQDALLENVTAIRISLYDWQDGDSDYFLETLKKIENLRKRVDREGSRLEIGASILTRREVNHKYAEVGRKALDAGIHWLYFHPYCVDWDGDFPTQADQTGVLEAIEAFRSTAPEDANIHVPVERYSPRPLFFKKLHGSHFLIQVGADGINYAGPECKYESEAALLDLNEYLEDDFLWHPQRLERLERFNSGNYRFAGTKHRPPIFSDYIESLFTAEHTPDGHVKLSDDQFSYPNIV